MKGLSIKLPNLKISLKLEKNMHPHFYLLFKTVISGWKGEDGLGENTTFMAYNSNKEVHLTGSGGHSNTILSCTATISPFILFDNSKLHLTLTFSF